MEIEGRGWPDGRPLKVKKSKHGKYRQRIRALFISQGNSCFYCENQNLNQMNIDHLIPRSKGGSNNLQNLVCACRKCNTDKNDRHPTKQELDLKNLINLLFFPIEESCK